MISKCANPACSNRFFYLHEGKLFSLEREAKEDTELLLGFDTICTNIKRRGVFLVVYRVAGEDDARPRKGSGLSTSVARPS